MRRVMMTVFWLGGFLPGICMAETVRTETEGAAAGAYGDTRSEMADPSALDYLFHKRPADGSAAQRAAGWSGNIEDRIRALDALNRPGFEDTTKRARFEKFLNTPGAPAEQVKNYRVTVTEIQGLLRENRPVEAWQRLFVLSDYPWDAGVSGELAHRIETIWDADRAVGEIAASNRRLRDAIERSNWNADLMFDRARTQERDRRRAEARSVPNRGSESSEGPRIDAPLPGPGEVPQVAGTLQMTEHYLQSLEARVRIKQNDLRMESAASKVRSDFADTVSTLFSGNRHLQVVLAAHFYRQLFGDGDYPVTMGTQVNRSLEMLRDVEEAVEAFRFQAERDELVAATEALQTAFLYGELHPAVRGLDREEKRRVADFAAQNRRMRNLIEARDFAGLEVLLGEMSEQIADFDASKPRALVEAVKLESRLRLGRAHLAAQQGDQAGALEEFRAAAEAWPGNPDLEEAAEQFFQAQDRMHRHREEFDRLFARGDYRRIFDGQPVYAMALADDTGRKEQFQTALEQVQEAKKAVEKANLMLRAGDAYGAWEVLELAGRAWPEDGELNRLRADLTVSTADLAGALNRARQAEQRGQEGLALSWYATALGYYPGSELAREGIERLSP